MFSRLFGKRDKGAPPEAIPMSLAILEQFSRHVMKHYGESEFEGDTQAKSILSVYCFGAVSALAMQNNMNQPQAHAVCIAHLNKFFLYSGEDSVQKAEALISAAPDPTSHLYPIIHRGLDSFLYWQTSKDEKSANDFAEIMAHFNKPNA